MKPNKVKPNKKTLLQQINAAKPVNALTSKLTSRTRKRSHKAIERRALIVGILMNTMQVLGGVVVVLMTGLQAMFLDTAFTFISVVSGIVAVYLSSRSVRATKRFPYGMFALEPIYAICKAIFTISLLAFSLLEAGSAAFEYFVYGRGERMSLGPVLVYELVVVVLCFALWAYYKAENREINNASSLLQAEASSTLVDALISAGIGGIALFLLVLPSGTPLDFLHYTGDFFITLIIVLFAVKEPFEVLRDAFVELVGGVHSDDSLNAYVMSQALDHKPEETDLEKVLVFKQGMKYRVDMYIAGTGEHITVSNMVSCKRELEKALKKRLPVVDVNFVFD